MQTKILNFRCVQIDTIPVPEFKQKRGGLIQVDRSEILSDCDKIPGWVEMRG